VTRRARGWHDPYLANAGRRCGRGAGELRADRQKELAELRKARSLLLVLLAATRQTRPALDGAAHVLETDIASDLEQIAERAEREIRALNDAITRLDD
jgi:hypothetical protein